MTPQDINKRFAELAELPWHDTECDCGICAFCNGQAKNPDFCADPRLVLEVMMKRDDWDYFHKEIGCQRQRPYGLSLELMMNTTGLLALKAIEWMEKDK